MIQQHRHAELLLERAQELHDLRLNRDVERGRRFVRDQQPRTTRDGHGQHHALFHAPRELMRILQDAARGRRDADALEQLERLRSSGARAELLM